MGVPVRLGKLRVCLPRWLPCIFEGWLVAQIDGSAESEPRLLRPSGPPMTGRKNAGTEGGRSGLFGSCTKAGRRRRKWWLLICCEFGIGGYGLAFCLSEFLAF